MPNSTRQTELEGRGRARRGKGPCRFSALSKKLPGIILFFLHDAKTLSWGTYLQKILVSADMTAALFLFTLPAVSPAQTARSFITVNAVVLPSTTLNVLKRPNELMVTEEDIKRGFVSVPEAFLIELVSNSREGCLLSIESRGLPFQNASVNAMGRDIVLGPEGGQVPLPIRGRITISLSFRFILSHETQPGTYAWPFSLSIIPLR